MQLSWEPITLDLKTPFRIAHGTSSQRHNVLVRLDEGVGEAPAVPYYGETQASILEYLSRVPVLGDDPSDLDAVLNRLPSGSRAARAAIDIALHDLWGKRLGQPLFRLFGLNPETIPLTSFTIALEEPSEMAQRAKDSGFPILKVKLGGGRDLEIVSAIRQATDATLRADANGGWSREEAAQLLPRLAEQGLELIEQPLAAADIEGLRWLRKRMRAEGVRIPILADESVRTAREVASLAGAVDGVVIKLMKTKGLREALRAIHTARAMDMQVMLSCMVETSVGVTAAAHLAALCDYVDLDGPLLIKNDPYQGLRYQGARIILPDGPGLGVEPRVPSPE
jgi:L-Ala-D/L-Glu epimerase